MTSDDFRAIALGMLGTVVAVLAAVGMAAQSVHAQGSGQLELPNPYRLVESWPTLPPEMNGGRWGELIRAQLDPDGNIWIFHRCFNTVPPGAATCVGRSDPPILQFAPSGRLLASLGGGMFAFPHGFTGRPGGEPVGDRRERRRLGARDARPRHGRPLRGRADGPPGVQAEPHGRGADDDRPGRRGRERSRHLQSADRRGGRAQRRHLRDGRPWHATTGS